MANKIQAALPEYTHSPMLTQHMTKRKKRQAQDFFNKYKDNRMAMSLVLDKLKQEEHLDSNKKRL